MTRRGRLAGSFFALRHVRFRDYKIYGELEFE